MSDEFDSEEQRLLCHLYQVLCADLPSCGCNDPQSAHKLVHDLVSLAPFYENEHWRQAEQLVGSEGAFQIVISALNDAELLEHGGSMGGSWLGKRGRWFLWAVEQVGGIEGLVEKLDGVGYPHGWDPEAKAVRPCEDSCWQVRDSQGPVQAAEVTPMVATPQAARTARQEFIEAATAGLLIDGAIAVDVYSGNGPTLLGRARFNQQTGQWEATR